MLAYLLGAKPRGVAEIQVNIVVNIESSHVVPADVDLMDLIIIGRGGAGATADYNSSGGLNTAGGGGGSGGGYMRLVGIPVVPGDVIQRLTVSGFTTEYGINGTAQVAVADGQDAISYSGGSRGTNNASLGSWASYVVQNSDPASDPPWTALGDAVSIAGFANTGAGSPGWFADGTQSSVTPGVPAYSNGNTSEALGGGGSGATTGYVPGSRTAGFFQARFYSAP